MPDRIIGDLRAAAHAPALNNFGSAVSIIQDELAHAQLALRTAGGGVTMVLFMPCHIRLGHARA